MCPRVVEGMKFEKERDDWENGEVYEESTRQMEKLYPWQAREDFDNTEMALDLLGEYM